VDWSWDDFFEDARLFFCQLLVKVLIVHYTNHTGLAFLFVVFRFSSEFSFADAFFLSGAEDPAGAKAFGAFCLSIASWAALA
jgi:hypothetical protein